VEDDLERITFDNVVLAAKEGDPVAVRALQEVGERLGIGVANLVNVFNPELIVLGGALNLASSILLPIVERVTCEGALQPACENLRVAASAHGIDACLMGTIALVLEDIWREPISAYAA
jgi:predicted NBD/HSP70 family sugar kinase